MIERLQNTFDSDIPITRAMDISVLKYDGLSLTLRAPLTPNRNDKGTAFGGSLYSVAVLSGWGLIYLALQENRLSADIMINESQTRFIHPVGGEIQAQCAFSDAGQIEQMCSRLSRRGLTRVALKSVVRSGGKDCLVFEGSYAVKAIS